MLACNSPDSALNACRAPSVLCPSTARNRGSVTGKLSSAPATMLVLVPIASGAHVYFEIVSLHTVVTRDDRALFQSGFGLATACKAPSEKALAVREFQLRFHKLRQLQRPVALHLWCVRAAVAQMLKLDDHCNVAAEAEMSLATGRPGHSSR